jgi:hypothetical protein
VKLIKLGYGSGDEEVSVGYILRWICGEPWDWMYLGLSAVLTAVAIAVGRGERLRIASLMTAVAIGAVVAVGASGGMAITRFGQPLFLVGYIVLAAVVLARWQSRVAIVAAILLAAGMTCFRNSPLTASYAHDYVAAAKTLVLSPKPMSSVERDRLRAMQDHLEIGTAALVNLGSPFLLDFTRSDVYVVDFPFAAGPAPGVPQGSAEELVSYMRSNRIRYVVYDYAAEANFPDAEVARRLAMPRFTPWQRRLNRQVPIFHERLRMIAARASKVYDDGQTWVVDLEASR